MTPRMQRLFDRIKHGDAAHQTWLRAELEEFEHEESIDLVGDVQAFAAKFGLTYDGKPRVLPLELAEFRREFLAEEVREYSDNSFLAQQLIASPNRTLMDDDRIGHTLAEMGDALVDEVYVAIGTALMHGFDFAEMWRRVQRANLAKVRAERASDSKRGTLYDVVKPPGWIAPDHTDLTSRHQHRTYLPGDAGVDR